jgi:hypothetical protein
MATSCLDILSQFPKAAVSRDLPDPAVPTMKTMNMFGQFTPRNEIVFMQSNLGLQVKAFSVQHPTSCKLAIRWTVGDLRKY